MQITINIPEFTRNERNLHCDVLHITTVRVARLVLRLCVTMFRKTYVAGVFAACFVPRTQVNRCVQAHLVPLMAGGVGQDWQVDLS